ELTTVASTGRVARGKGADEPLRAIASLARDDLVVLCAEATTRTEQRAFHRRPAQAEPLADLPVGETLEFAHDEDLVVGLGEPAERSSQVLELKLLRNRVIRL